MQGNAASAGPDDHHVAMREVLTAQGYDGRYVRKVKRNGASWPQAQIGNAVFWRSATFECAASPALACCSHAAALAAAAVRLHVVHRKRWLLVLLAAAAAVFRGGLAPPAHLARKGLVACVSREGGA